MDMNELATQVPQEILESFEKSIKDLKAQNIENKSIKLGEKMPDFSLKNAKNEVVNFSNILKKGKMIIAFIVEVGVHIAI